MVGVDGLKHRPVAVDVQPAFGAALTEVHALGAGVAVAHLGCEDLRDPGVLGLRPPFGGQDQQDRPDVQPACGLLVGEQRRHARVGRENRRLEAVECRHDLVQRHVHREDLEPLAAAAGLLQPRGRNGRCEVPAGRQHQRRPRTTPDEPQDGSWAKPCAQHAQHHRIGDG